MVNKEISNQIRASIINSALDVEDALSIVLGNWYVPSQTSDILETNRLIVDLLTDLGFEHKIKLFKGFIKDFQNEFSQDIYKNLNEIKDTRNQVAHRIFIDPTDPVAPGDELKDVKPGEFIFDKIGKTRFVYNLADLVEYQKLCLETTAEIYSSAEIISIHLKNKI